LCGDWGKVGETGGRGKGRGMRARQGYGDQTGLDTDGGSGWGGLRGESMVGSVS